MLGKAVGHFGIVTGSGTLACHLVYCDNQQLKSAFNGYTCLHPQLYPRYHLEPLRKREDLVRFLMEREVTATLDPVKAFRDTGGVGRSLVTLARRDAQLQQEEGGCLDSALVAAIQEDSLLFAVTLRFLEMNRLLSKEAEWEVFKMTGVPLCTVRELAQQRGIRDEVVRIASWCERGLVFQTYDQSIELLLPRHADLLCELYNSSSTKI